MEFFSKKILELSILLKRLKTHRTAGDKIVFTNGCFDIIHAGHVQYLTAAKAEGEVLVVGLNSDDSVRIIKGEKRPIVQEAQRAAVLAGLECVNYVTLFEDPDPFRLIQTILPDVLVKGADWGDGEIIGADIVKQHGGRVVRVPFVSDTSTSKIIETILRNFR
ncbi:MAG TPA: D-glycero-beta-D-manno-heptose 1-phosphate adenylyltransferase [Deltaproteobacteria bacterium]|nr:D-glycero-beta-D-manno-heptose 1-phosphate adenylyltransferase [Deltaproteobacteria bacterium]